MISDDDAAMLGSGAALLVGSVSPEGVPRASRAWGIRFLDGGRVRVVLAADEVTASNLHDELHDGSVAVTGTDIVTFRSIQLKGRVVRLEPARDADLELVAQHVERMFTAIRETDRTPLELQERLLPQRMTAAELDLVSSFDQTPGPHAGSELGDPG